MSDDLEKIILEMRDDLKEVKQFVSKQDVVSNQKYCELRGIAPSTLFTRWFKKGCPREDSRHVSIKAVDEWARDNNTRKKKP